VELYSQTATDESGNVVNGSSVSVTVSSSGANATIYDKAGDALGNPFLTGYDRSSGEVEFQAANNLYTITVAGNPGASKVNQALFDINEATTTGDINASSVELSAVNETFPGITTAVAVSNIYEPFLESDWPLMMGDKSWFDEDGVGDDGTYHGSITTTARDLLSPNEGDVCYNTTTSTLTPQLPHFRSICQAHGLQPIEAHNENSLQGLLLLQRPTKQSSMT